MENNVKIYSCSTKNMNRNRYKKINRRRSALAVDTNHN